MFLIKVSKEFTERFHEVNFILSNYDIISSLSKVNHVDSVLAASNILNGLGNLPQASVATEEEVHTAILTAGVRNPSVISLFGKELKVGDIRKVLVEARYGLACIGAALTETTGHDLQGAKVLSELQKAASKAGLSSSLIKELANGPSGESQTQFNTLCSQANRQPGATENGIDYVAPAEQEVSDMEPIK